MRQEGFLSDEEDGSLSPAEERALRAEKRAAWRAARMKSLEQDAMQAQMVIKSMTDMVGSNDLPTPTSPEQEVRNSNLFFVCESEKCKFAPSIFVDNMTHFKDCSICFESI